MKKVVNFGIMVIISLVFVFMTSLQGFATTVTVLDEQVTISDSANTGKNSNGTYTATAKGGLFGAKTNTVTITNASGVKGEIGFNYSATSTSAFTIDGASASTSGTIKTSLDANGTVTIVVTSNRGLSNTTATLTLTNISFQPIADSSKITYEFDRSLGSVTADGEVINNGDIKEISKDNPVAMVATPNSGVKFLGWVDGDGLIVSRNSTYTQESLGDKTIGALFSKNTPYFMVDEKYIFSNLNDAANAGNTIVLMCDGVLPAGDYEIPVGKTLLIPFDDANTLYTNKPVGVEIESGTYKIPTAYRTLALASGANITVNGAISVSAKHSASQGTTAAPIGTYGHIAMESGSTITVNSGAELYAWGYITGLGTITAESGSKVYECFQLTDYRGGSAIAGNGITSQGMLGNPYRVFPMSQYYVQNIEVPLTLEAGAIENGFVSIFVTAAGIQTSEIPFIGPDGMFKITSGTITKDYDEETDRLIIDVDGTLEMASLVIKMKVIAIGSQTVNSEDYTLPINGNITLNINSGSYINITQDIALLPGSEINVFEGAKCTFLEGAKAFIYDSAEWGGYCSEFNNKFMPVLYAPGRGDYTPTEADLKEAKVYIKGEVDASEGFVYTTASGADVQGAEGGLIKIKSGDDTVTYQAIQGGADRKEISYNPISVTTAWLKNADGTYTDPEILGDCCSSYVYSGEKWLPEAINHAFSEEWTIDIEATCTTEGSKSRHCYCSNEKTDITVIDALGHDITTYEAQAPTCEVIGWNEYETCSRCDYSTYVEKSALGHSYGEKWIEADAIYHKKVCANDGSHVITEKHTFVDFVCTACGYEKIATNTTYEIADEKITIDTKPNFDLSDDAQIMIATYDADGSLLNVAIKTKATIEETVSFASKSVAKIKVFVWDCLETMRPVSLPEELPITTNR